MKETDLEKLKINEMEMGMILNRYIHLCISYVVPRYYFTRRAMGRSYLKLKYKLGLTAKDVIYILNHAND